MAKTKFKSDIDEAIHSAASGLHRVGVISKKTMREYDELCIDKAPEFDAKAIAHLRRDMQVSQALFARYLNTSLSTVQQWERGDKKPGGMAARLLQVVQKHGLEIVA